MSEKDQEVEGFRLWWPLFLLAAFVMSALFPVMYAVPPGSWTAVGIAVAWLGNIVLILTAYRHLLGRAQAQGKNHIPWFLLIFLATITVGTFVSDWFIHLLK